MIVLQSFSRGQTVLVALQGEELVYYHADSDLLVNVVDDLSNGKDLDAAQLRFATTVKYEEISRIDVVPGNEAIEVHSERRGYEKVTLLTGINDRESVQKVVEAVGLPTEPKERQATLSEALLSGTSLSLIVPILFAAGGAYVCTIHDPNTPDDSFRLGRAARLKRLFAALYDQIGPGGIYALSSLVILGAIGFWTYSALKRPVVISFSRVQ